MATSTVVHISLAKVMDDAQLRISELTAVLDALRVAAMNNNGELREDSLPNALCHAIKMVEDLRDDVDALWEGCRRISARSPAGITATLPPEFVT